MCRVAILENRVDSSQIFWYSSSDSSPVLEFWLESSTRVQYSSSDSSPVLECWLESSTRMLTRVQYSNVDSSPDIFLLHCKIFIKNNYVLTIYNFLSWEVLYFHFFQVFEKLVLFLRFLRNQNFYTCMFDRLFNFQIFFKHRAFFDDVFNKII